MHPVSGVAFPGPRGALSGFVELFSPGRVGFSLGVFAVSKRWKEIDFRIKPHPISTLRLCSEKCRELRFFPERPEHFLAHFEGDL